MKQKSKQVPARRCRGKATGGAGAAGGPGAIGTQPAKAEAALPGQLKAADTEAHRERRPRPPGPDTCHQFVRRQLAKVLPDLFLVLVAKAQGGDLPAVKLLWQLAQLDKPAESGGDHSEGRKFIRSMLAKYGKP